MDAKTLERFCSRVNSNGGPDACWPWTGSLATQGYGKIRVAGRKESAHRVALLLAAGPAPEGKPWALHACDNPPCCNPSHLRWGSASDNAVDREMRGRGGGLGPVAPKPHMTGSLNHKARLCEDDVRALRTLFLWGASLSATARATGMSVSALWSLKHRDTWRHVP